MGVTNLKLCGADGEVAVDADAPYEAVNLSIFAISHLSQIKDLAGMKSAKTGKIHILYGRVGPLAIVATTSFRPVRIQAAAARTIVAKATSTADFP